MILDSLRAPKGLDERFALSQAVVNKGRGRAKSFETLLCVVEIQECARKKRDKMRVVLLYMPPEVKLGASESECGRSTSAIHFQCVEREWPADSDSG